MQTNRFVKLFILFFLQSAALADDLYLKNGFLYKNIRVIDTTGTKVNIIKDSEKISIGIEWIEKIDKKEFIPNQRSTMEIYSQSKYEESKLLAEQNVILREKEKNKFIEDSIFQFQHRLDSLQPWRSSVFIAVGHGMPQGTRYELGHNSSKISLALAYLIGQQWTNRAESGMLGFILTLWVPVTTSSTATYVSFMRGGEIAIFGEPSSYTQLYFGVITPLTPALHLRPEVGIVFTARHVSGGPGMFGGTDPIITENRTHFYISTSLEIDFRQVF